MKEVHVPWVATPYTYTYASNGWLTREETSRTRTNLDYNARGALSLLQNWHKTDTLYLASSFTTFRYDGLGNLTYYNGAIQPIGFVDDTSSNVSLYYDGFERVSREWRQFTYNPNNPGYDFGWSRDNNGNITVGGGQQYPPNADNQVTGPNWSYDNNLSNGSATSIPGWSFAYDLEGRPTSVIEGGTAVLTNGWRRDGLRGWKQDRSGKRVYFLYDGDTVVAEILASDASVYAAYGYGPNGLAQRYNGDTAEYWCYTYDPLGNPVMRHRRSWDNAHPELYAQSVAVYDGMGQMYSDLSTSSGSAYPEADPIGPFAQWGAYTDEQTRGSATGLAMSSSRYYDPSSCRYLTRDELYGNPYVGEEDDGSATILFFELASMVPIAGAPFALAMGAEQLKEGDYLSGALNIGGAIFPLACESIDAVRGLKMGVEGAESLESGALASGRVSNVRPFGKCVPKNEYHFVQDVADDAERIGVQLGHKPAGGGPLQGTAKHEIAKDLAKPYEDTYGLKIEKSFKDGLEVKYGKRGSLRPDVYNEKTGMVYDYKFRRGPAPAVSAAQRARYQRHLPNFKDAVYVTPH